MLPRWKQMPDLPARLRTPTSAPRLSPAKVRYPFSVARASAETDPGNACKTAETVATKALPAAMNAAPAEMVDTRRWLELVALPSDGRQLEVPAAEKAWGLPAPTPRISFDQTLSPRRRPPAASSIASSSGSRPIALTS